MNRDQRRHGENGDGPISLNVPILGAPKVLGKGKVGAGLGAIPRHLDAEGMMETTVVQDSTGQPRPVMTREMYLDAEELLQAIREVVREELRAILPLNEVR